MDKTALEAIGLTKSEIDVYLALLEIGSSSTGKIVEKSGTASSKVYEILDKLISKGLASFVIKSGVKYFQAATPQRIMDYIKEKEEELQNKKKAIEKLMPELEIRKKLGEKNIEARVYKGFKGVQTAFYMALEKMESTDEFLVFGIPQRTPEIDRFFVHFGNMRAEKKISSREIFKQDYKGEQVQNLPLQSIKYSSQPTFSAVNIFKERILIFPETEDLTVIEINGKEISDSFRSQFEQLWNQDVKIYIGWDALRHELNSFMDDLKKNNEEYLAIGAAFGPEETRAKYIEFFNKNAKYRAKLNLPARILYEKGTEESIREKEKDYVEHAKSRFLPYKTNSPVAILPSKEKTLMVIQKKEPVTIILEGKEISEYFKQNFETLWNQEIMTYEGDTEVQYVYTEILKEIAPDDEVIIFASEPKTSSMSDFNIEWCKKALQKCKGVNLLYTGMKEDRIKRAKDMMRIGCKVKILDTELHVPISNVIFGETILNGEWETPFAYTTKNKFIAESYRENFKIQWNNAKEIK